MRPLLFSSTIFSVLAATAACGGGDDASGPPRPVATVAIVGRDTLLNGQAEQFQVELRDEDGKLLAHRAVTWTSLDPALATVTDSGLVATQDTGTARLVAASEGVADTLAVVVYEVSFAQVDAGEYESCAVTAPGRAFCWGRINGSPWPTPVPGPHAWSQVAVGRAEACGLTTTGETWCWTDSTPTPAQLAGAPAFARISLGSDHGCGITPAGAAWCWGKHNSGQLGDGTFNATPQGPVAVAGGALYVSLSPGSTHTCAVTTTGIGQCWGNNGNGQLGIDSIANTLVPLAVMAPPAAFREIQGNVLHTCGIAADSTAWCWGDGNSGQMGDNQTFFSEVPVPVHGSFRATRIDVGQYHTCALAPGGAAWCWGSNDRGQLGIGTQADDSIPAPVSGGLAFQGLATGTQRHSCGLTTGGVVYCWGDNTFGQLGVGGGGFAATPTRVTGQP